MVEEVKGGIPLPDEVVKQTLEKTDGVPVFVEELTKTVVESGALHTEGGRYVLDRPLDSMAIPATLQDSLMSRLDRLGQAKEIAQVDAVIGREFSHELLESVTDVDATETHGGYRTSCTSRSGVSSRRATAGELRVQACVGTGHGLRKLAQSVQSEDTRDNRARTREAVLRPGRARAGTGRTSSSTSRIHRAGD